MQALLENEVVSLYRQESIISEFDSLMESAKDADAVTKSRIENDIVARGAHFVPELVNYIQNAKGVTRGICAMCLIRIGEVAIGFLKEAARTNREFAWAADYIVREIKA